MTVYLPPTPAAATPAASLVAWVHPATWLLTLVHLAMHVDQSEQPANGMWKQMRWQQGKA